MATSAASNEGGRLFSPEEDQFGLYREEGEGLPARWGWQIYFCAKETIPSTSLQCVVEPDLCEI